MVTVPAQSLRAPLRAKFMAAARFMPGVEGTLVSSESLGTTWTPVCFQASEVGGSGFVVGAADEEEDIVVAARRKEDFSGKGGRSSPLA